MPGMESGGSADVFCDIGGAAELLMGLWLGEAGMARPSLGTLFPDCDRPAPGTGGRRRGAGEAMLARFGGLRERDGGWATTGKQKGGRLSKRECATLLTACLLLVTASKRGGDSVRLREPGVPQLASSCALWSKRWCRRW